MSRLKVCLIVTGFPTKDNPSHGIFNKRAADSLSQFVDLTVLQLRVWKPGRKFVELVPNADYTHYYIAAPHLPFGNNSILCSLIRIYSSIMVSRLKDVIQQTNIFHSVGASFSGALGSKIANKFEKKHIVQLIGTDVNSELPELLQLSCFKLLKTGTQGVGSNSLALKKQYETLMGTIDNIEVIYRGIDVAKFEYSFDNYSDGKTKFLFLGGIPNYRHLEEQRNLKGGVTLMNTWKNIEVELASLNCELIFAGPDSDSDTAIKWHNSLHYKDNVILKGMLAPDEVLNEYKKCQIVLIPSLEEGMPNVALEAGATGKCLIASNVGGLPEIVCNNNNGYLINPGDEKDLGDRMIFCARHKEESIKMGNNLRKRIEREFNANSFASNYVKLYEKIMKI